MNDAAPAPPESPRLARQAAVVGAFTILSRVTGFVRDGVIAFFLGTGPIADAFYFAFRIPNLFRRLLGEGAVSAAFIPVFAGYESRGDRGERDRFVRASVGALGLALLLTVLAGILAADWLTADRPGLMDRLFDGARQLLGFAAPAARGSREFDPALAATLTRWFFPYLLLVGLAALAQGCLNALGQFAIPAAAPVALNLALIFGALFARSLGRPLLEGLVAGVLAGGVLQLLIQLPALRRAGIPLAPAWDPAHPGLRTLLTRWLPGVWGASIYQVMIFSAARFAAAAEPGTVAALYYAGRVSEVAYGVVIVSTSAALLPAMARHAQAGDLPALRDTLRGGLRWLFFIIAPAAALLALFADPLVALLLQRGEFNAASAAATAAPTAIYATGLLAQGAMRLLLAACHATGDTRSPALIATLAFAVFFVSAGLLAPAYGGIGIALATLIGVLCATWFLGWACRRRLGGFGGMRALFAPLVFTVLAATLAAGLARLGFEWAAPRVTPSAVRWLVLPAGLLGGGLYLLLARLAGVPEAAEFIRRAGSFRPGRSSPNS